MHWAVLIPIGLIVFGALIITRNELAKRRLTCPHKGEPAEVEVQRRHFLPTDRVRIKSCDLLPDSEEVDCDQACVKT